MFDAYMQEVNLKVL